MRRRRVRRATTALAAFVALGLAATSGPTARASLTVPVAGPAVPASILYVWAGDAGQPVPLDPFVGNDYDAPQDDDFLAVVDADPRSATYGKVMRTVSVLTPPGGNEPHHVATQVPRRCGRLVANGLFSDTWFTFDLSHPTAPSLVGTIFPHQTVGTVPQHAAVLPSCEILGTEQGGPLFDARGTVVRLDPDGRTVLEERPAARVPTDLRCTSQWNVDPDATGPGGPYSRKTSDGSCLPPSPLGIALRADLATLITSDFAAPGPLILPTPTAADVTALTVRHYALRPECTGAEPPPAGTACLGEPRVFLLPDGPRVERDVRHEENVVVEGLAATHAEGSLNPTGATPPGHVPSRGAFAATTCGGALYYTPDVAAQRPEWREVFDFSAANEVVNPGARVSAGCVGGGGLFVTPDNRFVVASLIGREEDQRTTIVGSTEDTRRFPGMIVLLDVERLVRAGARPTCTIDDEAEVWVGGSEDDCPSVADLHVVDDPTSGGPHDLALDYPGGGRRLAFFDYFVSETGVAGDLRLCILRLDGAGLRPDPAFPAAVDGQEPGTGCVSFDRIDWPSDRGAGAGAAKPHHGMFWSP